MTASASGLAVRRLRREFECLQRSQNPQLAVRPSEDNLLEWHFVLQSFPDDTPYHGGCYHGKILFPPEYPHAPPGIVMITPSGRLETGKRLCLSMTDFHPESWNPAWSVETILLGLLSFFVSEKEEGYGAITAAEAKRKALATESHVVNARSAEFRSLFPEFADLGAQVERGGAVENVEQVADADFHEDTHNEATGEGPPPQPAREGDEVTEAAVPAATVTSDNIEADTPGRMHGTTQADVEVQREGEAVEAAGSVPANGGGGEDETPMECWICRDTTGEPLIQPCACRGSMSGVHASCVEDWIRHHRRSAVNDGQPRCSVCHQHYQGYERRPGMAEFLRAQCSDLLWRVLRTFVLVSLVMGYQLGARGGSTALPLPARVSLIALFAIAAMHKVVVLTVSLPPHRPPPRNPLLRRFFVADYNALAMHVAETFVTVTLLSFFTAQGLLELPYSLPIALASLIPIVKICIQQPSLQCLRRFFRIAIVVLLFPVLLIGLLVMLVWRNPRRAIHPLDAPLHTYVALAVFPLCFLQSDIPVVVLLATHSALIALGLIEMLFLKKLQWREGPAWVFTLQLSAFSAMFTSMCTFPEGWGSPQYSDTLVKGLSGLWCLLLLALSARINKTFLLRYYRTWQRRHGTFTLQAPDHPGRGGDMDAIV